MTDFNAPDALLSAPAQEAFEEFADVTVERAFAPGKLDLRSFLQQPAARQELVQYCGIYSQRLEMLRGRTSAAAHAKWDARVDASVEFHERIMEARPGRDCVIIGTFCKVYAKRVSVVHEYANEEAVSTNPTESLVSDSDYGVLEDPSGRMRLAGAIPVKQLVTGLVVAVLGHDNGAGEFVVQELCLPGVPPQPALPQRHPRHKILLTSGLRFGDPRADMLATEMLTEFATGLAGAPSDQASLMAQVVRVVVAGELIAHQQQAAPSAFHNLLSFKFNPTDGTALRHADIFLTRLAASLDVDLVPGLTDPANFLLPQKPMHRCLFPSAIDYHSFHRVSNPYRVQVDGVTLLGTAGQPTTDMLRFMHVRSCLDAVELTLRASHVSPTSPDSLGCFPSTTTDPFVLESAPHVYFVGNQERFESRLVKGETGARVLCIAVPAFWRTHSAVLLELHDMSCEEIQFDTSAFAATPAA